jgi:hypothetical protein
MSRGLILTVSLVAITADRAWAQSAAFAPSAPSSADASQEPGEKRTRLMLGIDLKQTTTLGPGMPNKLGAGFMWRWRSRTANPNDRLAFSYRFGSYSSRISGPLGGGTMEMGPARFRPVMAGAEYKMPRGKWTWSVGATVGLSLNQLDTSQAFQERLAVAAGTPDIATDIHNSFAWSPRFKGWYDYNRRISVVIDTYYAYNRPEISLRRGAVTSRHRINADAWVFKTGIVYGIW